MSRAVIEEIARTACKVLNPSFTQDCKDCPFDFICDTQKIAESLYDAGYRKQSECENITEQNHVDEFQCSECGIVLCDWTEVKTDVDDGDKTYHEYEFKFCPNCGAKVKVESDG